MIYTFQKIFSCSEKVCILGSICEKNPDSLEFKKNCLRISKTIPYKKWKIFTPAYFYLEFTLKQTYRSKGIERALLSPKVLLGQLKLYHHILTNFSGVKTDFRASSAQSKSSHWSIKTLPSHFNEFFRCEDKFPYDQSSP